MDTIKSESIKIEDEVVIERIFDAPRDIVWSAFTDPDCLKKWWGPKDFTAPVYEAELHPGGRYFGCMRSPEGKDFCSRGEYRETSLKKGSL